MENKILLFNRWDVAGVQVRDPGLKRYINLRPVIVPKSSGKYTRVSIRKANVSIVERFINKLCVPGRKGKKHKITSGRSCGRYQTIYGAVRDGFEIIYKKTNKNPLQVLVDAVENGALLEEVMGYRLGGMIARKAVVTTPQRRLDISLKLIAQNIYSSSFNKKGSLPDVIANELIAIAANDQRNNVIRERIRIEKEAEGAR
jgi:small subunit ribosomal protein S7